jgi:hypothetical protein
LPLDGVVLSAAMAEQSPSYFHVTWLIEREESITQKE